MKVKYYVGIDGGGSKTIFCIANENGQILGTAKAGSAAYKQIGVSGVLDLLREGITEVSRYAEGEATQIAGCCFGMPAWGESPKNDKVIEQEILKTFPEWKVLSLLQPRFLLCRQNQYLQV